MLEFLIGRGGGHEEAVFVSGRETTYYAGAGYGALCYGDEIGEFGFEDTVEGLGGAEGEEAVGVCES